MAFFMGLCTLLLVSVTLFMFTGCAGDDNRHEVRYSADGKDSVVYVHYRDDNGRYNDFFMNYLMFQTMFGNGGSSGYTNVYHHYHANNTNTAYYPAAHSYTNYKARETENPIISSKRSSSSGSNYSSPARVPNPSSSSGSSYSSPARSKSNYSSPSRSSGSSYSSPSRSYSSPSRSYSSPSRSYSSPSRH
jgi:hypothetical protein